jgi:hypothetical protein
MEAPDLARAIADLMHAGAGDPSLFRSVLDQLVKSTLIAAKSGGELMFVDVDEEGELLALFTSPIELFTFDSGAVQTTITGEEAIRLIASGEYDGLVIDPRGNAFELSRDDIEDMFEID